MINFKTHNVLCALLLASLALATQQLAYAQHYDQDGYYPPGVHDARGPPVEYGQANYIPQGSYADDDDDDDELARRHAAAQAHAAADAGNGRVHAEAEAEVEEDDEEDYNSRPPPNRPMPPPQYPPQHPPPPYDDDENDYEQEMLHLDPVVRDQVTRLRDMFYEEARANPDLYDRRDLKRFFDDPSGYSALRYLVQRSYDEQRAFKLVMETLRWRHRIGLNQVLAEDFPCELFRFGLIFESNNANHELDATSNPVIWIRLGALGKVVKNLEKLTPGRLVSYTLGTAKAVANEGQRLVKDRSALRQRPGVTASALAQTIQNEGALKQSMQDDKTFRYLLLAIAWWIEDFEQRHGLAKHASLVLDFENTDSAFSSWSMGEFFIGLDDHFPDLFDNIIGFRYKPKIWSLHSPISMFNRIFTSRITSSPETDKKLKFVRNDNQLGKFIPRVDSNGMTLLPEHLTGECFGPSQVPPARCQKNARLLQDRYDQKVWKLIEDELFRTCKAKRKGLFG